MSGHAPKDVHHQMSMKIEGIVARVEELERLARETKKLTGGREPDRFDGEIGKYTRWKRDVIDLMDARKPGARMVLESIV